MGRLSSHAFFTSGPPSRNLILVWCQRSSLRVLIIIIIIISIIIIFASIAMSLSRPGRAIRMEGDTLVQQAKDLTQAIEELVQENKDLKETLRKFQGNEPLLTTDLG